MDWLTSPFAFNSRKIHFPFHDYSAASVFYFAIFLTCIRFLLKANKSAIPFNESVPVVGSSQQDGLIA